MTATSVGSHTVFAPNYGSPFVRDLDNGRRYGTIEDFRNFVKLAYASPHLHHSGGTVCEPVGSSSRTMIFGCIVINLKKTVSHRDHRAGAGCAYFPARLIGKPIFTTTYSSVLSVA